MPRWARFRLVGPMFMYDLVRSARRGRHLLRAGYALLLLAALLWTYTIWLGDVVHGPRDLFASTSLPTHALSGLATSFFVTFATIQIGAVFALTPAYVAGALAQEKQRGALEALLATDLRSREIVLGLLLSRLANLILLVVTGLPILSLTLLWGGVDARFIVAAFVAAGLSMASLAALSMLQSVRARRPRDAVLRTYLVVVGYLVGSGLVQVAVLWAPTLGWGTALDRVAIPLEEAVTVRDVLTWPCMGNPLVVLSRMEERARAGGAANLLGNDLQGYAIFHLSIALLCIAAAVVSLRTAAQATPDGKPKEPSAAPGPQLKKPRRTQRRVRARAGGILWKETVVEARPGRSSLGWLWLGVRLAVLFWLAMHICYSLGRWWPSGGPGDRFVELMNLWVRAVTVLLGCFMLLGVAVRAAGSVSGERDRRTLDALLSTPLETRTLLFAKWLGSILGSRGAWVRLGLVYAIGIMVGALHPLAALCLLFAWFVYAAFLASLGLYFSVTSRSAHRAIIWTLMAALGAGLLPALAAYRLVENWQIPLEGYALAVPATLGLLAFSAQEYDAWARAMLRFQEPAVAIQLLVWALAACGFYVLAALRFRVLTGRLTDSILLADRPQQAAAEPSTAESAKVASSGVLRPGGANASMDDEPERLIGGRGRSWPGCLRNAVLALLPLAALLACYGYLMNVADKDYRDAIAQTDRLEPSWRIEELEAKRLVVPDSENSSRQLLKAKEMLPKAWDTAEADTATKDVRPEVLLRPEEVQAVRAALANVPLALAEARRLSDLPHGRYPVNWSSDVFSTLLPHLQETRSVAKLLALDALRRAQDNDADGALTSCRALLNAARSIGDEPTLISLLVRISEVKMALDGIERTLAQGEPSEKTLKALQDVLEEEDRQPLLLLGMRGERAGVSRFFEALRSGEGKAAGIFGASANRLDRWATEMLLPLIAGSLKACQAEFLRNYNALVEAAKLPPEQQDARFGALGIPASMNVLVRMIYPAIGRIATSYRRDQAEVRCALAALAVERYRRQHGRWPVSLSALVPGQLADVPLDPYDGQPLRYRQVADGTVIYSVGPDLVDDGGKLVPSGRGNAGTDLGMRLWNPDRRRLPPSTANGPPNAKAP
jgi:ABC-type transport system involved in multi-copper enzyme maturation permease subunit